MRIVVALGGNALSPRGAELTMVSQRAAADRAAMRLAVIARTHELVVTHGNGPQVGLLALQAAALDADNDVSLDLLDAETAGLIGHLLELGVTNHLPPGREAITLLTRTLVDVDDPAFDAPTKFVGPTYDPDDADDLRSQHGWSFAAEGGALRRIVPSPSPLSVAPLSAVDLLLSSGCVVVCGGGGGVPVVEREGLLEGVEAVVDKDAVSALLAIGLDADLLVIASDVDGVYLDWGTTTSRRIDVLDVADHPADQFAVGSMRPKVEAAAQFARSGQRAVIGSLHDLPGLVAGTAGTEVVDSSVRRGWSVA